MPVNFCDHCGTTLREEAQFCSKCGVPVLRTVVPAGVLKTPQITANLKPSTAPSIEHTTKTTQENSAALSLKGPTVRVWPRLQVKWSKKMIFGLIATPLILILVGFVGFYTYDAVMRHTSLDYAIDQGDVAAVTEMLDRGVQPVASDTSTNYTPLMRAVLRSNRDSALEEYQGTAMLKAILVHKADVNAEGLVPGRGPSTALAVAAVFGNVEEVQLLLAHGAMVNGVGGDNGEALCAAVGSGKPELVRLMLDHGANVNLPNSAHSSALDLAKLYSHDAEQVPGTDLPGIISMLEAAGAR